MAPVGSTLPGRACDPSGCGLERCDGRRRRRGRRCHFGHCHLGRSARRRGAVRCASRRSGSTHRERGPVPAESRPAPASVPEVAVGAISVGVDDERPSPSQAAASTPTRIASGAQPSRARASAPRARPPRLPRPRAAWPGDWNRLDAQGHLATQIPHRFADLAPADRALAPCIRRHERVVARRVHEPRHASREPPQAEKRSSGEEVLGRRHLQRRSGRRRTPPPRAGERTQARAHRDALAQLADLTAGEQSVELRAARRGPAGGSSPWRSRDSTSSRSSSSTGIVRSCASSIRTTTLPPRASVASSSAFNTSSMSSLLAPDAGGVPRSVRMKRSISSKPIAGLMTRTLRVSRGSSESKRLQQRRLARAGLADQRHEALALDDAVVQRRERLAIARRSDTETSGRG